MWCENGNRKISFCCLQVNESNLFLISAKCQTSVALLIDKLPARDLKNKNSGRVAPTRDRFANNQTVREV